MSEQQQEYIITEAVFNHVVAALRDNRQYDVAECLIAGSRHHTPAPAAEFSDAENKWCDDYAAAYNRGFDAGAKAAREDVLETLEDLRKWSNGEYNEAYLSDNEREMRIHNDYGCKIWGVMQSLRSTQQQAGDQ